MAMFVYQRVIVIKNISKHYWTTMQYHLTGIQKYHQHTHRIHGAGIC